VISELHWAFIFANGVSNIIEANEIFSGIVAGKGLLKFKQPIIRS
jgi:hypothetical protein